MKGAERERVGRQKNMAKFPGCCLSCLRKFAEGKEQQPNFQETEMPKEQSAEMIRWIGELLPQLHLDRVIQANVLG